MKKILNIIMVSASVIFISVGAYASTKNEDLLKNEINRMNISNPVEDLNRNIENQTIYYLGLNGYTTYYPGINEEDMHLLHSVMNRIIAGTSDYTDRELMVIAEKYAETYNKALIEYLKNKNFKLDVSMNRKQIVEFPKPSLNINSINKVSFEHEVIAKDNQIVLSKQDRKNGPQVEWVPSSDEIAIALDSINDFLASYKGTGRYHSQAKQIKDNIANYMVQVLGIVVDGKKIVHCNFFLKDKNINYAMNEYVYVMGGGSDYWNINFDVEDNKCLNLWINGES